MLSKWFVRTVDYTLDWGQLYDGHDLLEQWEGWTRDKVKYNHDLGVVYDWTYGEGSSKSIEHFQRADNAQRNYEMLIRFVDTAGIFDQFEIDGIVYERAY